MSHEKIGRCVFSEKALQLCSDPGLHLSGGFLDSNRDTLSVIRVIDILSVCIHLIYNLQLMAESKNLKIQTRK